MSANPDTQPEKPARSTTKETTFRAKERITKAITPELVIALCGPLGTPLHRVSEKLSLLLTRDHKYNRVETIKLSDFIRKYGKPKSNESIEDLIEAGNSMRSKYSASVLAQLAVREIALNRAGEVSAESNDESGTLQDGDLLRPAPVIRHCHIIDSIKNSQELELLRLVYGRLLHVISVYSPLEIRTQELEKKLGSLSKVFELINRDSGEEEKSGQSVRDVFPLADFFLRVSAGTDEQIEESLRRYLDLLLGVRIITPTPAERAMYEAHSAARNSACLSRQVGAAISDSNGDLLAVGWNDVPRAFGGLYESNPKNPGVDYMDQRCWQKNGGTCFNDAEKDAIASKLTKTLIAEGIVSSTDEPTIKEKLRRSGELKGLIEFSRAVHAEMHALLNAGQSAGQKIRGGTLYVTTYPCHSCARHIIASGIREIRFIEPYRKSLAVRLHSDAITENELDDKKVRIIPFDGVAPSRFLDLFSEGSTPRKDPKTGKWRQGPHVVPITAVTLEAVTTLEGLTLKELESVHLPLEGESDIKERNHAG